MNDDLIDEIGMDAVTEAVVTELRRVQDAPHVAAHALPIDGDIVYLRRIGEGAINSRVRCALMLAYTLYERTIEPLWVFKAIEESPVEEIIDSGPLGTPSALAVQRPHANADGPISETVEHQITRVLRNARKNRRH
jgi:hypothetical protein